MMDSVHMQHLEHTSYVMNITWYYYCLVVRFDIMKV